MTFPSSQSSLGVMFVSPQKAAAQVPPLQKPPMQGELSGSGVPAMQMCVAVSQVPLPAQTSAGAQSASIVHENWQLSQPSPFVTLPSSQSSGGVTNASPQTASPQTPFLHTLPMPQSVLSAAG